jgi:hypothetical protein
VCSIANARLHTNATTALELPLPVRKNSASQFADQLWKSFKARACRSSAPPSPRPGDRKQPARGDRTKVTVSRYAAARIGVFPDGSIRRGSETVSCNRSYAPEIKRPM